MDKQNINEELEKFKLLSSYSTKKTLSENIEQIKEQYSSPEEEIYYTLVRATSGYGTNEKLLQQAFEKFQNYGQFYKVSRMLKDKPIEGHTDIIPLLRSELGTDDGEIIKKLADTVRPKGISINYTMGGINKNQLDYDKITVTQVQKTPSGYDLTKTDEPKGDMAKVKDLETVVVTGRKNKTTKFRPNDNFPLKIGDSGPKIKKLQFCLGLPAKYQTGNFGETTMKAIADDINSSVDKKQPPNGAHVVLINEIRTEGMKKDIYDSFIKDCKGVAQPKTTDVNPEVVKSGTTQPVGPVRVDRERPDLTTGVPKTLPTQAPTIQTPTTELSLEQQFQMAKINLDKAKKELDAAQTTNDRAKIGAARGKQQAARKEVQRLRNELYPPQQ